MQEGDLQKTVKTIPFDKILVLADPDAGCNFDLTTLQYANGTPADDIAFLRINLFVRLWRKLGWSIEETDRALQLFAPQFGSNGSYSLKTALIYLAHLKTLDKRLKVGRQSRLKLLTLWADIATTGKKSLYEQLFLTRNILKSNPIFDAPLGNYLQYLDKETSTFKPFYFDTTKNEDAKNGNVALKFHNLAVQGALGLTADDISLILEDAGKSFETAELSLSTLSLLYRYGLLAKALKLSVRELITLKQLSGLDPFKPLHSEPPTTIEQDHPFSQTLRFVEIVEQVRDGGLKIEDLDYLLRHCFDETGPYRPNREKMMGLLKTLSEGIRAIRAEHVVPVSPDALGEETLRQKLGLALTPDVVERFLAMMNGTAEFTATVVGEKLAPETFTDEPAIRQVVYNEIRKEQKLTFRGVLVEDIKEELKKEFAAALIEPQQKVFASLLDNIQNLARDFFDNQLKKQPLRLNDEAGFLEDSDYEELFQALTPLKKILPTDTPEEITNKVQQNEDIERENQKSMQQRRYRTAQAFLPWLQQRLIRQFTVQTMVAQTSADPALVESLVTDERLLAKPDANPLLVSFAMTGEQGINATLFDSDDLLGENQPTPPILRSADTALKDATGTNGTPLKSANSARFEGYFEVPAPGAYRLYVMLEKKDAEAELRLDHLPDPVFLKGKADVDNKTLDEYLELKTGILYRFSLELKKLNGGRGRLLVQSETLPKDGIDQLKLHPLSAMAGAQSAIILLTKALQLVQSLGLSEREISYVLTHAKDFGDISLSRLPIQAVKDTSEEKEKTTQQFTQVLRLVSYVRLKNDLAAGTNDLIELFETNGTGDLSKVYPLIAKLTRRDEATVKATANALVSAAPTFASEEPLVRLWEALQIVERFGVSAASLQEWTDIISVAATPEQRFEIAHELKDTIKARFEPETWQRVAQPIFDKLRQRQRDALVAHVMHQHRFDRIEQLYEYFLIDPGMEPVVQTSRIRLAISTVQLFIQRCLLNLERNVHTSAINSKQWEWMKRYRVWEANRKIFLFPENWLEPEFRDDKTHLFTELEGALLQGDVSSDLVEDAFLNYLKKLDELARLDIIAMHCEDKPDPAQNTLHVFGRTFSQPHKYFYRRYAHQAWTPWEPVTAEIEGDHLAPVVWRDRLYLFWVTFMDKPNENGKPGQLDDKPSEASLSQLMTAMQAVSKDKQIDVQLHWSEYLHGEWSTRVSGGFVPATSSVAMLVKKGNTIPTLINTEWSTIPITVPLTFDTRSIFIHVAVQATNKDAEEGGVYIHLKGTDGFQHGFYLAGRNCLPEKTGYINEPRNPYNVGNNVTTVYKGNNSFEVTFNQRIISGTSAIEQPKTILNSSREFTLLPCNNDIRLGKVDSASVAADNPAAVAEAINSGLAEIASLMKPVFYQDKTNTLFVEPNVTERTIEEWNDWIPPTIKPDTQWGNPDWWKELPVTPDIPKGARPYPGTPDTWPQVDSDSYIKTNPGTDWLVNSITGLVFDGEVVGPQGHAGLEIVPSFEGLGAIIEGGIPIEAQAGSHLAAGDVLVIHDDTTFGQSGLTQQAGGLNVVGNAGLNSTLAQNVRLGTNSPARRNGR